MECIPLMWNISVQNTERSELTELILFMPLNCLFLECFLNRVFLFLNSRYYNSNDNLGTILLRSPPPTHPHPPTHPQSLGFYVPFNCHVHIRTDPQYLPLVGVERVGETLSWRMWNKNQHLHVSPLNLMRDSTAADPFQF